MPFFSIKYVFLLFRSILNHSNVNHIPVLSLHPCTSDKDILEPRFVESLKDRNS